MTPRPRVLVLLASYQGENFIVEQVESILNQTGVDVSILVSVDPSSDRTYQIVDGLVATDPTRIGLLEHDKPSGGAARNFYRLIRGRDVTGYDYVGLADQDDVWFPHKLARSIEAMRTSGSVAYSSNVYAWDGLDRNTPGKLVQKAQNQTRWDHLFSSAGPGCTYVATASTFDKFSAWLTDTGELIDDIDYHDWLMYAWYRSRGYSWFIDAEPTMLYRQHDGNQIGANVGVNAARARVAALFGGWFLGQVVTLADVLRASAEPPIALLAKPRRTRWIPILKLWGQLRRSKRDSILVGLLLAVSPRQRGVR